MTEKEKWNRSISRRYFIVNAFVILSFGLWFVFTNPIANDIIAFCIAVLIGLILIIIIASLGYKKLAFWVLTFYYLHVLSFPALYTSIINYSKEKAFIFDPEVEKFQYIDYQNKLREIYNPERIKKELELISKIRTDKLTKNLLAEHLPTYSYDIKSKNFDIKFISSTGKTTKKGVKPPPFPHIDFEIFEKSTNKTFKFQYEAVEVYEEKKLPVDFIFQTFALQCQQNLLEYFDEMNKLENKKVSSYSKIIFLSINIFFNGNMAPSSFLANLIYFIHYILLFIFILGTFNKELLIRQTKIIENLKKERIKKITVRKNSNSKFPSAGTY